MATISSSVALCIASNVFIIIIFFLLSFFFLFDRSFCGLFTFNFQKNKKHLMSNSNLCQFVAEPLQYNLAGKECHLLWMLVTQ